MHKLTQKILDGHKLSIAKGITAVENNFPDSLQLLEELFPYTTKSVRIGITGPPGAGKSTLTNELAKTLRLLGKTVGIVAVDPSSQYSGGAILGDRIRMSELFGDSGIFIRSMATRGSLGGLSLKAKEVGDVLAASGKDVVIYETVGVGQSELEIVKASDTVVVVLVPEAGDSIQAMKSGLMEIADIFVVNKSDREGSERFCINLQSVLEIRLKSMDWIPPVLKTVALKSEGIDELSKNILAHSEFLKKNNILEIKKAKQNENKINEIVESELIKFYRNSDLSKKTLEQNESPYAKANEILEEIFKRLES
ncbi:MAG: methylmalonyl Co-A mutase-associated GTPase MeaB [Calditrichaeota bacterium]|nr:MAG: methylmalonyl Co-A mutase-associated GTPase MeaB [Calditrichota bacterium]